MSNTEAEAAASTAAFERVVEQAVEALRGGRREDAGLVLWDALRDLDAIDAVDVRRSLAGRLASVCWQVGFDDLALFALDVAIELDKQAGLVRELENDRILLGNVHLRLGNLHEAETVFELVAESGVRNGNFANAASASTNLAGILAAEGYLEEAAERLERSLEYVEFEPFPDTERNTRFLLLQVLDATGASPARVLDLAESLGRWADELDQPHRLRITEVVESALGSDPERRTQFSWLLEHA